jgi:uncharacterized membrane protein
MGALSMMLIRKVPAGRGWHWLTEGFRLFRANPLIWIVDLILFLAICTLLSLLPFFGTLASALLQPVLLAGLLKGASDVDQGGELRIEHLFDGFRDRAQPLVIVGLLLGIASLALGALLVGVVIGSGLFGAAWFETADWSDALPRFPDQAGLWGILVGFSAFLLLSLPLAMAAWFAPALVMLRGFDAVEALKASFAGSLRNMWPFTVYGALLLVLIALTVMTFGIGLLVLAPVVLCSVYAGYKDIFVDERAPRAVGSPPPP